MSSINKIYVSTAWPAINSAKKGISYGINFFSRTKFTFNIYENQCFKPLLVNVLLVAKNCTPLDFYTFN